MNKTRTFRLAVAMSALWAVWSGCREQDPIGDERNRFPETYLVQAPTQGQAGFYINHLFWDGFDPDGRIAFFEVTVTDSFGNLEEAVWHKTFRTDSLIRFPVGGESGQDQVLGNRFYVRAVDDLDFRDPDPAWVFFGARNPKFPEVIFTDAFGWNPDWPEPGNPDTVWMPNDPPQCGAGLPPDSLPAFSSVHFEWNGVDRDSMLGTQVGFVTAFEYKLSGVNNTFIGGTLADTMATYENLEPGVYTFTVRTIDDGGLAAENCRYFNVNFDPVVNICKVPSAGGDSVKAFRISRFTFEGDPCGQGAFNPYDPSELPPPPVNPDLPPGYLVSSDTLLAPVEPELQWWFEFDVATYDPDGEVDHLEVNVMECIDRGGSLNCGARVWRCAATPNDPPPSEHADCVTVVAGPFTSGDWRVVVAAVDDLDQRGAASADTIDFYIDKKPRLVTVDDVLPMDGCTCFAGGFRDTVTVCDNDTLYTVRATQPGSTTPCALETNYADGSGQATLGIRDPADLSPRYQSFPQQGQNIELAFSPDSQGRNVADLCALLWLRDPDGTGRVGYIRFSVDRPISPTQPFEIITNNANTSEATPDELTPTCFVVTMEQDTPVADHTLYVEIRDWLQRDVGAQPRVAERTSRQEIRFTVTDISNARYTLPGRNGR